MIQQATAGQVGFKRPPGDDVRQATSPAERQSPSTRCAPTSSSCAPHAAAGQQADADARAPAGRRGRARPGRARDRPDQLLAQLSPSPSPSPSPSASPTPAAAPPPAAPRPVSDRPWSRRSTRLDWYLGASLQIRQGQFDATMDSAALMLGVTLFLVVVAAVIAGLTFWGVQPRIEEYAA